jgi:hypothetical protein
MTLLDIEIERPEPNSIEKQHQQRELEAVGKPQRPRGSGAAEGEPREGVHACRFAIQGAAGVPPAA